MLVGFKKLFCLHSWHHWSCRLLIFSPGISKFWEIWWEQTRTYKFAMVCNWSRVKYCLMTVSWLSRDFLMIFSRLSHNFLTTFSQLFHNCLITFSRLSHEFLMTFLGLSHYFLMPFSRLSQDFIITFSWPYHDFSRLYIDFLFTFSWLPQEFFMTVFKYLIRPWFVLYWALFFNDL